MGLVILAALCVAGFAILFRLFEQYRVPLLPAIAVNYAVAFICGVFVAPPWHLEGTGSLLLPAALLGALFVLIFALTGLSAQRAGAARTTIAGRMSLVLTITGTVVLFNEHLGAWTVLGIALALVGLVLTATSTTDSKDGRSWVLPLLIFLCSGAADIAVTFVERELTSSENASSFPTLCFAASATVSLGYLFIRGEHTALHAPQGWVGGLALGIVNYASLLFLVRALGDGTYPASTIFPAMNILAILFATAAGLLLFRERIGRRQWIGIALCVVSLVLIMSTTA